MHFPSLTLLLFTLVSCGGGSRSTSDETAVAATSSSSASTTTTTTSISSLNKESTSAVGLYVKVLTGGANLALTSFATADQAQFFQSLVVDAVIAANAHTSNDKRTIHTAAHNVVVEAAIKAGIKLSPALVVKFTHIAMEHGNFSKEDMEALLRASLLKANFPKDQIRLYIAEFMKIAPETFGENLAQAMVAVTADHMPPEEVLATIANSAHHRPGTFGDRAVASAVTSAQALGLSQAQLASLMAAVDTTSANATANEQIQSLLEGLVASVAALEAAAGGSTSVLALAYESAALELTVGLAMTAEDPENGTFTKVSGTTISSCEFTDLDIPGGLEINASTCVISGTPTTAATEDTYTITVTDSNGATTTDTIDITIVNKSPVLAYSSATIAATQGVAITSEDPTAGTFTTGGTDITITNCTVTPDLPSGISLNTTTCVISGTTSDAAGTATYTVTVTNSLTLTATDTIDITISGTAFSTSLDLSTASDFNCDGAGSCATNNDNITISGGTAAATSTDLKKNTDAEWNATGATLTNVAASSNTLVMNGTTNAAWTLSADWTPQWDDIFIYYHFDETSGNAINIANSGTNDGVLTNGATRAAASAKVGANGIVLDGDNDYVDTTWSLSNTDPTDLTIMGWFKVADLGTGTGTLMGSRNGAQVFNFFVDGNDSGKLELFIQNGSTWRRINSTATDLDDDAWHHYAVTYGPGGTLRIYVDGNLEPATTLTGYNTLSVPEFCIGCYNNWGTRQSQWVGSVDEFAIFKDDLTATEVALIYQRQKTAFSGVYTSEVIDRGSATQPTTMSWNTTVPLGKNLSTSSTETTSHYSGIEHSSNNSTLSNNLLAYFNFDGDTASGLPDITGNGHNSTSVGGTVTSGYPGAIGNAWRFDNGQTEHGDITTGGQIGISVWLHPDVDVNHTDHVSIVSEGDDGEWDLQYYNSTSQLRLSFHDGTGWANSNDGLTSVIPKNEWSHIVVVRDSNFAGDQYVLYVNGAQADTSSWYSGGTVRDVAGSHDLQIGGRASDGTRRFRGLIDELGIWSRGLTANEVAELYRRGASRIEAQMRSVPGCNLFDGPNLGWLRWHPDGHFRMAQQFGNHVR